MNSLEGLSDDLFIHLCQVLLPLDCFQPFFHILTLMAKVVDDEIDVILLSRFGRVELADMGLEVCQE